MYPIKFTIKCRYKWLKLLPNDRVPGFMFHQTERHFNNGTGDDSAGRYECTLEAKNECLCMYFKQHDCP